MANAEKPNVDFEDPAKRPSLDDQYSSPAERAVLGTKVEALAFSERALGRATLAREALAVGVEQ